MGHAFTAFPDSYLELASLVGEMEIDVPSLRRPLKRCELAQCRGTCCHDGVYLSTEEARVIRELVEDSQKEFEALGADLPERAVVYGKWRDFTSGPKTATRDDVSKNEVEGYPDHFPKTSCVFLLPDVRCSLQVLAAERGLPGWYFKPATCWLHPLAIETDELEKPLLTLHNETNDPQTWEDYDGFVCRTHCGRTTEEGEPAYLVLRDEIEMLGKIGDRDLMNEIEASIPPLS